MMKSQIAMPIAIVIILIAVIIPLPTIILDVLISTNIALSVVILLSAVYLLKPVQFSSFPSILLMTTLFRLSLNIASTRLILLNGSQGLGAAGDIIGGLFIGVFQYNMPVVTALTTFTVLTIGDGLVTAIPSLLISIAGGLVTTHAASDVSMGQGITTQLFSNPKPVYFGAGIVAGLGLISGFPKFAFLFLAGLRCFIAYLLLPAAKERALEAKPDATSEDGRAHS